MLRAVLDEKAAAKKRATKHNPNLNLPLEIGSPGMRRNPFRFIE